MITRQIAGAGNFFPNVFFLPLQTENKRERMTENMQRNKSIMRISNQVAKAVLLICVWSVNVAIAQDSIPDINEFIFVDKEPTVQNLGEVRQQIVYPEQAVEEGIVGTVVARVLFDAGGKYVKHKIVKEIDPLLDEAVAARLPELRCEPAMSQGKTVAYWMNIPFPFKLINEREKQLKDQIKALTDSLTGDPEDYTLWHKRGIQRSELGQYEDALSDINESLGLNPRKNKKKKGKNYAYLFYSQYAKGAVLSKQDDYEAAIAELSAALQTAEEMKAYDSAVQATVPSIYADRGYIHFAMENYDAAMTDYQWVLENDPDQECDIYSLMADVGLTTNDYAALVGIYDGLIRCTPDNPLLNYSRGYYKMETGDYAGAVEDFNVSANKSENVDIKIASRNQAGYCLLKQEKYEEAQAEIQKGLDINALNPLAYLYNGLIVQAQGDAEAACEYVRRSLSFGLDGEKKEEAVAFMEANCGGWEE